MEIEYIAIAPVASSMIQFVSNFAITTESDQVTPKYLVLNIAVDSNKTAGQVEVPIFIPAKNKYPNSETNRMQQLFRSGEPFVAVHIEGLKIYKSDSYYGFGTDFSIIDNPSNYIEEEILC